MILKKIRMKKKTNDWKKGYDPSKYFVSLEETKRKPQDKVIEITVDNNKSAVITAELAKEKCKVLIDTGATRCCLREDYFNKIPNASLTHLRNYRIRSASGKDLQTLGKTTCPIIVGSKQYQIEFIVCRNLIRPAILGLDFLRQNRIGTTWTPNGTFALQRGEELLVESIEVCFQELPS